MESEYEPAPEEQERRSTRNRKPPERFVYLTKKDVKVPEFYLEAINSTHGEEWKEAISDEMNSLEKQGTWTVVDKPTNNRRIIGSKWVFAVKTDPEGNILRFKARFVARGFSQQRDIDFHETYAPVVDYTWLRVKWSHDKCPNQSTKETLGVSFC